MSTGEDRAPVTEAPSPPEPEAAPAAAPAAHANAPPHHRRRVPMESSFRTSPTMRGRRVLRVGARTLRASGVAVGRGRDPDGLQKRRDALQIEVATAESLIARVRPNGKRRSNVRKRYPKSIEKGKARKPGFMQNLMSFGNAGACIRRRSMRPPTQRGAFVATPQRARRRRNRDAAAPRVGKTRRDAQGHANSKETQDKFFRVRVTRPWRSACKRFAPNVPRMLRGLKLEGSAARTSRSPLHAA